MKKELEQAKQFYMDLWAYHLQSTLYLRQDHESDAAWQKVIQDGRDLIDRYGGRDQIRACVVYAQDEIARTVRSV